MNLDGIDARQDPGQAPKDAGLITPQQREAVWQAKLVGWLRSKPEQAVLFGRERPDGGTTASILPNHLQIPASKEVETALTRASRWAIDANRPGFPGAPAAHGVPAWQQPPQEERPTIVHPLSGVPCELPGLAGIDPAETSQVVIDHFRNLARDADARRTALAFWRFGAEVGHHGFGGQFSLLPADHRVPDHTLFDHQDLVSALATAFVLDPEEGPALLGVSVGPVQEFIATSRSTSDLWAGSHLLSRLSWEAMRVICETLGPDAIVFPRIRGIPQVDLWLRENCGLAHDLFSRCHWTSARTDSNPLFAAALPNRFTAIVPAGMAGGLASAITERVRAWAVERANEAYKMLLETSGIRETPDLPGFAQIREQLDGFPEIHWVSVPWNSRGRGDPDDAAACAQALQEAMKPFTDDGEPGFLASESWLAARNGVAIDDGTVWRPSPGFLYPAVQDLLERALAAVKSARPFAQMRQEGWRDSLSGEAEWLTTDRRQLDLPPGDRRNTIWMPPGKPAWARKDEHLSALNALKRLWPTLFLRELRSAVNLDVDRFVVSTHTMALATSMSLAADRGLQMPDALRQEIDARNPKRAALPRKLARSLAGRPGEERLSLLPAWLDDIRESGPERELGAKLALVEKFLGHRPEAYYGLILMDGDRMGAWLSADGKFAPDHGASLHPGVRTAMDAAAPEAARTLARARRPASPSWQMAISDALNNFALRLAPAVVEHEYNGRILYAGGDDLMAMVPVLDLLPVMADLRATYTGTGAGSPGSSGVLAAEGYALSGGRWLRTMPAKATASCGAVIAHHQAPLVAVLRELRAAERRAKDEGGRNAFSLSVVKRSGGMLRLTARWGRQMSLLIALRTFLGDDEVSRRAAFNCMLWLRDLPETDEDQDMVRSMLTYQLRRQCRTKETFLRLGGDALAEGLADQAFSQVPVGGRREWLGTFLLVGEFLARETRLPARLPEPRSAEAA